MKKIILSLGITILVNTTAFAQLNNIYDDNTWEIYAQYTSITANSFATSTNFQIISPFGMRVSKDQTGLGKNHIVWNPRLGVDLIWSVLLGLTVDNKINDLDALDSYGFSNGILGQFNWTKNIIGKDKFVVALGIELADYATGSSGYHFGLGPSILTDYAINDKMGVGVNFWASKSLASTDKNSIGMWFYGIFPRFLYGNGWFIQPGLMFTSEVSNHKYSRLEFSLGKKIGN